MLIQYTFNQWEQAFPRPHSSFPPLHLLGSEEVAAAAYAPILLYEYERINLQYFRWGLVPNWAKSARLGASRITAPAHNIFRRPAFQRAIRKQRCLIPADSFTVRTGFTNDALIHRLSLPQHRAFFIAGVYDRWEMSSGECLNTFAIITQRAPSARRQQPVLISSGQASTWLDPEANLSEIKQIITLPQRVKFEVEPVLQLVDPQEFLREQAA